MTEYDRLKKIIPPDQALANQALSRSLRQIKKITDVDLPTIANTVVAIENNAGLADINDLASPLPPAVSDFYSNTFATGTGVGNTLTINDMVGIAAGATVLTALPVVIQSIDSLAAANALNSLAANAGSAGSVNNGIFTQMQYTLGNAYGDLPVNIPATVYWAGGTFTDYDTAFANGLIPAASSAISSIASINSDTVANSNQATDAIANQLLLNQNNLIAAGIDIGNIVIGDWANSNIQSNQQTAALMLGIQLHSIGQDVEEGGAAQFFEQVANLNSVSGQAVIASMREGRNIALFNGAGLGIDAQLSDVNGNTAIANNLGSAQSSPAQARANIIV